MRAALGIDGYFAQAFFAFLGRRIGGRSFARFGNKQIHRLDDKEENRSGD